MARPMISISPPESPDEVLVSGYRGLDEIASKLGVAPFRTKSPGNESGGEHCYSLADLVTAFLEKVA